MSNILQVKIKLRKRPGRQTLNTEGMLRTQESQAQPPALLGPLSTAPRPPPLGVISNIKPGIVPKNCQGVALQQRGSIK